MPPPGFQWDERKNRLNIRQHGIDFNDAVRIFEGPTLELVDDRYDYGEDRTNALGLLDGRVVPSVTHTERNGDIRLISARAATSIERDAYRDYMAGLSV